ncbi:MAG TPA: isoleucine--tRNA ligase [Candidatus Diapherotrites archaeon]|nr:isoleucine--tRNA ligase [Candidatus Diapherotrites archaeon]
MQEQAICFKENMFSPKAEEYIQSYWKENDVVSRVRNKPSDKNYYFIDGPPYATGKLHLGTAMNRMLKDVIIRYHRQNGYRVLDIPGFDTHGVPTERMVQLKYNLKTKEEIESFGIDNFIKECRQFATKHIQDMSNEIFNLGQWMDWEHPYITLDPQYMESEWWTFKKAYEKGLLYHGKYPIHVCPECETSLSFNEIEHEDRKDTSIYVKMQSVDDPHLYYVIWTTTPWTLPANLGIMVNPSFKYVEVIVGQDKYILAKDLVERLTNFFGWKNYSLGKEYLGKDLEGKKYKPLLEEWITLSQEDRQKSYKILLSPRYVHLEDGTGLVHTAPGHGKEDYEVGKEYGLPIYCPVTLKGTYDETVPKFSGQKVKPLDPIIIDYLQKKGAIIKEEPIVHSYPICWRCKSPLLQVSLPQWFLRIEPMKERLIELNNTQVSWYPSWAKDRFNDWLNTISDWPISRSRYWGTPIPIWVDEKGEIYVFGSLKELKEKVPDLDLNMDFHKPEIDKITFKTKNGVAKRIPDVFDVWFDSGIASWAGIGYPQSQELFDKYWPADITIEGSDQIRGWWNSQLICSAIVFDKSPYKHVSLHGLVLDEHGSKLSKSLGNDRPLDKWISDYSRDYLRYYFAKEYNGEDIRLDRKKFSDVKRMFDLLENIFNFLKIYTEDPVFLTSIDLDKQDLRLEDKWILSKFSFIVNEGYKAYENTEFSKVVKDLEKFVLEDLSRTYIKLLRDRQKPNDVLNYIFSNLLVYVSPIIPHFTEYIYLKYTKKPEDSIHLLPIPNVSEELYSKELEDNFDLVLSIVQTGLSLREENKFRLRWLLPRMVIEILDSKSLEGIKPFKTVLEQMLNVNEIVILGTPLKNNFVSKVVSENVKVYLDKDISSEYKDIWEKSELTRIIQDTRKKKQLNPKDKIKIQIGCSDNSFLEKYKTDIENSTNSVLEIVNISQIPGNKQTLISRDVCFLF